SEIMVITIHIQYIYSIHSLIGRNRHLGYRGQNLYRRASFGLNRNRNAAIKHSDVCHIASDQCSFLGSGSKPSCAHSVCTKNSYSIIWVELLLCSSIIFVYLVIEQNGKSCILAERLFYIRLIYVGNCTSGSIQNRRLNLVSRQQISKCIAIH